MALPAAAFSSVRGNWAAAKASQGGAGHTKRGSDDGAPSWPNVWSAWQQPCVGACGGHAAGEGKKFLPRTVLRASTSPLRTPFGSACRVSTRCLTGAPRRGLWRHPLAAEPVLARAADADCVLAALCRLSASLFAAHQQMAALLPARGVYLWQYQQADGRPRPGGLLPASLHRRLAACVTAASAADTRGGRCLHTCASTSSLVARPRAGRRSERRQLGRCRSGTPADAGAAPADPGPPPAASSGLASLATRVVSAGACPKRRWVLACQLPN